MMKQETNLKHTSIRESIKKMQQPLEDSKKRKKELYENKE